MKLSGAVANMTSMVAGAGEVTLSMGKPDDTGSVADSAFETCSGFSGATSIGVSPFSGATSIGVSPFSGATSIGVSPFSEVGVQYTKVPLLMVADYSWNKMYSTCTYHQCIVCMQVNNVCVAIYNSY